MSKQKKLFSILCYMISISLCMIVKNEEDCLPVCLSSVQGLVDEIIIVDTGSIDDTKLVARKFTDKVYDFKWQDNFADARNFSFSKSKCEYIMWLDADDVILSVDAKKLLELKSTLPSDVNTVMLRYNTAFDNNANPTFSFYRERLVKKGAVWFEPVHEYIEIKHRVITCDIAITHTKKPKPDEKRNLKIYQKLIEKGETLSDRGRYYYARELAQNGEYVAAIENFQIFLDGGRGWVEDVICAYSQLYKCQTKLGKSDAIINLYKTFDYDVPRKDVCNQIATHFQMQNKHRLAHFWSELAKISKVSEWGFRES